MIADANLQVWLENSSAEEIDLMARILERRVRQARIFLRIVLKHDPRCESADWQLPLRTAAELSRN